MKLKIVKTVAPDVRYTDADTEQRCFRLKEVEEENQRLRRDRDQKVKDADFWRARRRPPTTLRRTQYPVNRSGSE